jgi:hypothetical protein
MYGFKGGSKLDALYGFYPAFTVTGVLAGLVIGLVSYLMMYKYLADPAKKPAKERTTIRKSSTQAENWPIIDPALEDVVKAIRTYSENLPKGVYRTILVQDGNKIDVQQLAPILGGIPAKSFYMSKETYEVFPEHQKNIPPIIDTVQKAVDLYVKDHKKFPMLPYDPLRRVNYYQLLQGHYLDSLPEMELYITHYDGLVSHVKPSKKHAGE